MGPSDWNVWCILLASPILLACGQVGNSGSEDPATPNSGSPQEINPQMNSDASTEDEMETVDLEEADSEALPMEGSTYRHPEGVFEISFPPNYAWRPQANGVRFLAANGEFGGEVIYFEVEESLTTEELGELYRQRAQEVFRQIAWQRSELQPDGSVRLDWRGKNAGGQDLDAIGYIEQHGNRVYILNVYAINESYDIYLDDSRLIVGSYQVERNP